MADFEPPTQLLLGDLEAVIRDHARSAARDQQVAVGPSEIGGACNRKLALSLLGAPKSNGDRDEWTATVGTALHTWMEGALLAANEQLVAAGLPPRWLVEQTVEIATGLVGHTDAYDMWTATVCDWKFPGVSSIRKYRKQGHPGRQYRWQGHLYGKGWVRMGMPVREVAIVMFPRSGLIRDAWIWHEPYSAAVAEEALAHRDGLLVGMNIAEQLGGLGEFLAGLDRDTEHCSWCPFWTGGPRAAEDPTAGCAGSFEDPGYAEQAAAKATEIPGIL